MSSKRLKRQIRAHIRTIKSLQKQQERSNLENSYESDQSHDNPDALLNLGENMVNYGTVPQASRSSRPFSQRSRNRDDRSAQAPTLQSPSHINLPREEPSARDAFSSNRSSHILTDVMPNDTISPQEEPSSPTRNPPAPSISPTPEVIISTRTDQSLLSAVEVQILPDSRNPETSASNPESGSRSNCIIVRPSSYLLHFDPSHPIQSESGFINKGLSPVTAIIDPDFGENMISQALATRLDLHVEPPDENEEVFVNFGDGSPERSIGTAVLLWGKGPSSHQPPFKVRCLVCVHDVRPLVFGQPFLEKRKFYWESHEQ
jgi:hypothetical protein